VIALEALSEFSKKLYSKDIQIKVTYTVNGQRDYLFVNNKNRLLLQEIKLNNNFKENGDNSVHFEMEGSGTALFQLSVKYNIANEDDTMKEQFLYGITSIVDEFCENTKLIINARFNSNEKESSEMAIISVRLPTGWIPIEESIQNSPNRNSLSRFDINDGEGRVYLYFDKVSRLFVYQFYNSILLYFKN
jgi:hypothetical protein